ncbi:MAG: hypothetical protein ABIS84_11265 [Arachnia sp.]
MTTNAMTKKAVTKKLCAGITVSLMLAATAWVGGTGAARADYTSDRTALCGAGNDCTITIADEQFTLVEAKDKATVQVTGKPGITSKVQMYTVELSQFPGLLGSVRAYGSPVSFTTNASGSATVKVPIATLKAPDTAATLVAFQLPGATLASIQDHAIEAANGDGLPDFTRVRSARGADATYSQTVTDGLLDMRVAGGLTGDIYGVQIAALSSGKWRDITDMRIPFNGIVFEDGYADVYADVSGFADGDYEVRVFNRTRGFYDLSTTSIDQGVLTIEKNIYITAGEHLKNGRRWRTTCEPYSQTDRCRTEIWATTLENKAGTIVKRTGWAFNNLTYKESARSLWKGNPLGNKGTYTLKGRKWRTECDTPATGGNGCRSFITTTVVEAVRSGRGTSYRLVTKEVFNNIVLFESPA